MQLLVRLSLGIGIVSAGVFGISASNGNLVGDPSVRRDPFLRRLDRGVDALEGQVDEERRGGTGSGVRLDDIDRPDHHNGIQ